VRVLAAQRGAVEHLGEGVIVAVHRLAGDLRHRVGARDRLADLFQRLDVVGQDRRRQVTGAHLLAGGLDRVDDGSIAGAATVGVLQAVLDLLVAGVGVGVEQRLGLHDKAGRAEAALRRAVLDEGLLEGVKFFNLRIS
jgi:hypothetical protein